jgi:hypothetical protein
MSSARYSAGPEFCSTLSVRMVFEWLTLSVPPRRGAPCAAAPWAISGMVAKPPTTPRRVMSKFVMALSFLLVPFR